MVWEGGAMGKRRGGGSSRWRGGRRRGRGAGWLGVKGGEMARVGKIRFSEDVGEFVRVSG